MTEEKPESKLRQLAMLIACYFGNLIICWIYGYLIQGAGIKGAEYGEIGFLGCLLLTTFYAHFEGGLKSWLSSFAYVLLAIGPCALSAASGVVYALRSQFVLDPARLAAALKQIADAGVKRTARYGNFQRTEYGTDVIGVWVIDAVLMLAVIAGTAIFYHVLNRRVDGILDDAVKAREQMKDDKGVEDKGSDMTQE